MARVVGRRSVERRGGEAASGRGARAGRPGAARLDVPELPGSRGTARRCGLGATRGAQTGGVRPRPLRGAASHEAEGRSGARGGGVDRVGPPTGWHRLRLLCQIGDQLVAGLEQFLLVNNVVAVEDGAALVPGQEHGDAFGDVRADQVAGGGAPAIVEEAGRYLGRLTGGAPRRAPAANGNAVAVEDQRAVGVAACPPSRQRLSDGGRDGEDASHQRLRAPWREPDNAAGFVDLLPSEAEDLLLAPAGIVGEVENVLPRCGQVDADGEVFGVLEEALAGGFSRSRSGNPGTVSSQPQWTASVHIRWRAEVSRLIVPVAAPAARRAS